jgi:hypothetical protein
MVKKLWYSIDVECIKNNVSFSCDVGTKWTVAKVLSKGLAFIVADNLQSAYKPEYFKITIK